MNPEYSKYPTKKKKQKKKRIRVEWKIFIFLPMPSNGKANSFSIQRFFKKFFWKFSIQFGSAFLFPSLTVDASTSV